MSTSTGPDSGSNPTAPVGPERILLGLNTFGDVGVFPDGHPVPHAQVLRQLLEQAELADEVGLHAFGVGEHHRRDFAVSAPEVFLAAAAARTKRIRLGSAVTVLSSDDPIRVFQRFSTVDALSNGRAEVMLGRGSFIESFPLFGLDLADYEVLFEEKLELFDKARAQQPIHWEGRTRPAINGLSAYPPLEHHLLPAWIGVGGTPESVLRCAEYGYPDTVAAKIVLLKKNLAVDRFDLKYSNGTLPHKAMMRSIELFGTEVAPRVAARLAAATPQN